MCEFCTKHGEGKIWYKNAANYADDLLSDLGRRGYIENFLTTAFSEGFRTLGRIETIYKKKGKLPAAVKTANSQQSINPRNDAMSSLALNKSTPRVSVIMAFASSTVTLT